MAYPYYNYNNPYQNYYQPMYQPVQQQPVLAQQAQQASTMQVTQPTQISNVWIYNESEVSGYPVAPNNAVRFWIANKPMFYEKSADATGKPTVKVFDYKERDMSASEPAQEQTVEYATKNDLSAVVGVVNGFDELISGIKSDVDAMKGDLWGIAGQKKKSTTKKTSTEDAEE